MSALPSQTSPTSTTTAPTRQTPIDSGDPEGVGAGRAAIDGLDADILRLIAQRVEVSAEVQRARIAAGGRRLSLSREADILARYRDALGKPGITIAMALLDLCRGQLSTPAQR
jgi:chorismate mutase